MFFLLIAAPRATAKRVFSVASDHRRGRDGGIPRRVPVALWSPGASPGPRLDQDRADACHPAPPGRRVGEGRAFPKVKTHVSRASAAAFPGAAPPAPVGNRVLF